MEKLLNWFDERTGYRDLVHEALYENVPGGSRWRYVWGSTLVFTFMVQVVTGLFLWMAYSPSTQTAWESVYYIQFEMSQGWLLRGIHHYTASLMVVLLALHLLQVVIDGAYRAPREVNFWLGLVLLQIVLGLALTGYLLPWDQKGYWATKVATKIAGIVPVVGPALQSLVVGGNEYGHHTLTRFFALHAGILPIALVGFLALHIALFRRHGIKAKLHPERADQHFWPDQVLKDAVACLAVLLAACLLTWKVGAELGAPADPANSYDAARPEWYFLFLFQFLKFFHGETGELVGAIVVPGVIMGVLALMPILGRWRIGHAFNVCFLIVLMIGAGWLTFLAWREDFQARGVDAATFADVEEVIKKIDADVDQNKDQSKYHGKDVIERIALYFDGDAAKAAEFAARHKQFAAYEKSKRHLEAIHAAQEEGERAVELARGGIPPTGALTLVRQDPKIQGPRLFQKNCASCHNYQAPSGADSSHDIVNKSPTASNLFGFGSRAWVEGILDPEKIASVHYFGYPESKLAGGDMVGWVNDNIRDLKTPEEKKERAAEIKQVVIALSAEAALPAQASLDAAAAKDIAAGRALMTGDLSCTDCHRFHDKGDLGMAPELTGYASRDWLTSFISNPAHERFYGDRNDRMPAFANADKPANNLLDERSLGLLVDWLRGDWPEPPKEVAAASDGAAE